MRRFEQTLAAGTLACALLAMLGPLVGWRWLSFVFKPLATVLVIAFAAGRAGVPAKRWIVVGLVLSLAGDIALLWPQGFVAGLVSFLLAHVLYLVAFTRGIRLGARPLAFAGYAVVAGAILAFLWPGVPPALRLPVLAYVVALASMAAQASAHSRVAAVGGALFVTSDALLATNKFAFALPASSVWILATYWLAQWCIAASLPPRKPGAATSP